MWVSGGGDADADADAGTGFVVPRPKGGSGGSIGNWFLERWWMEAMEGNYR